ncbi:isoprenoid biosynthesis glyoxalase ElbB [Vibrio zhugei]|uniref:Glyoxalase n=1 Tax=Vibrio zhugei TaxID=2479546 RepID=A0ABV7CCW0_9VIBR|nr:isoprenoid biosynthesis glyoxalase ElbB [Vibrio zhugei]
MKKVAVILGGCGVYDGSEIHEAVLTLQAIERYGASWHCFAPNIEQAEVINHLTGEVMHEKRNVLVESARIARGHISDVAELSAQEYDAIALPGGFGMAKNVTNFAVKGADCQLNDDVAAACQDFAATGKPAGYICISPHIIPMIYQHGVEGTIGNDEDTAAGYTALGGQHVDCPVEDYVLDQKNNVLSTPAYMLANNVTEAATGIDRLIKKLVELA